MKSIWSVSGGKTSSYGALHYPADYNIFALVQVEDPLTLPKDKGLIRAVEDKIDREFVGTVEDDLTLQAVLDLEQVMGREIIWKTGETFDKIIQRKLMLPNQRKRFCTQEMKIKVIFDWWFWNVGEPCKMMIGYRFDEQERVKKFTTKSRYVSGNDCFPGSLRRQRWSEITWREGAFPLVDNKIIEYKIKQFWEQDGRITFPVDSNCVGCFWKNPQQLLRNARNTPAKFDWFVRQEQAAGATFKKGITYKQIRESELDPDYLPGGGPGCQAGHCTD